MSVKESFKRKLELASNKVSWQRIKEVAELVWLNLKAQGAAR